MLKTHVLASTVEGRPIQTYELVNDGPTILVVAGFHGDEPQSAYAGNSIVDLLHTRIADLMDEHLLVVPCLNLDGLEKSTRCNANGVDLNRNYPSSNWKPIDSQDPYYGGPSAGSEPETQMMLELFRRFEPRRILSIHCIDQERHCINYDGPAEKLAQLMATENGYEVRAHIGHPTPGSLGAWAGYERKIPVVTLELPAEQEAVQSWQQNRDAIINFIQEKFES